MTLIKPVRGLDAGFREKLEAIAESDADRTLQVIVAIEEESDPAYPVAKAFAAAHPERDILVAATGPSLGRMGKIHNMIEALPKARHDIIIFSDADVRASTELLKETGRAFKEGADAAFALPYQEKSPGLGGAFFQTLFNHGFAVPAALSYYAGSFRFYAGGWMAYRKEIIDRIGGLAPFAHKIADDYALGSAAAASGAKIAFLPVIAVVDEETKSLAQGFTHFAKWASIIHACLPGLYFLFPLFNFTLMAGLLLLCGFYSPHFPFRLAETLSAAIILARAALAAVQDRLLSGPSLPAWAYPLTFFSDLACLPLGFLGLRRTILWRGTKYRLKSGGDAEVIVES